MPFRKKFTCRRTLGVPESKPFVQLPTKGPLNILVYVSPLRKSHYFILAIPLSLFVCVYGAFVFHKGRFLFAPVIIWDRITVNEPR